MDKPELHNIFPTCVYRSGEKFHLEESIIDEFKYVSIADEHTNQTSNNYILELPRFKELKEFCMKHLNYYTHEVFKINSDVEFYITQSWINVSEPGQEHYHHKHPNSIISSVLFITGQDDPIKFKIATQKPFVNFEFPLVELNMVNSTEWWMKNDKGILLLFPSNVLHCVDSVKYKRATLSFNTFARGTLGTVEGLTQLKLK